MATSKFRVHFMGIGGSGMSAVAALATRSGYSVDGCDQDLSSPYIDKLKKKILIREGHSLTHTAGIDLLVVTPAVYFQRPRHEELYEFENVMTWQEFLGKYLQEGKRVVCVAGTHGKSTTTAMLSLVFEASNKNPNVILGATVKTWKSNYRFGGEYFIVEADEFYDSFLHYKPEAIILNNIEFDHPDYFKNGKVMLDSFKKHIVSLKDKKILVANIDSPSLLKLLNYYEKVPHDINIYKYTLRDGRAKADVHAKILERAQQGTRFLVKSEKFGINDEFFIKLTGDFNVSNALGVIILSRLYSIELHTIHKVLSNFRGIGRRMELIGKPNNIYIYDDYAHHPTAIEKTFKALEQKHPASRIFVVIEPHSYSRTRALRKNYAGILKGAYRVIIAPIFKARDIHTYNITEKMLSDVINHEGAEVGGSFEKIALRLTKELKPKDVVIVMGAGKSHELSREILSKL